MRKIKVLHVLEQFNQGGIENFILNLFKNIDREKFEFHFAIRNGKEGVLDSEIEALGGKIHYFDQKKSTKSNLKYILNFFGPFDAVHSHLYFFSGYLLFISNRIGVPIRIAHCHETYKGQKYSLKRKIYEKVMRKMIDVNATLKLGCSKAACIHLYGKFDSSTHVVHNAIELKRYCFNEKVREKVRTRLHVEKNYLLGHVGRFEDQKDHDFLIEVFSKVHERIPMAKLLLIGSGSLKDKIEKKVYKLGLTEYVIFLENRTDVNELMQAMDVFVFPSKYEGLSIVEVEAQAAGLNGIVSSSISEEANITRSLITLNKDNIELWVDKICSLQGNERLDNINCLLEAKYDIKDTASYMSSLYEGY